MDRDDSPHERILDPWSLRANLIPVALMAGAFAVLFGIALSLPASWSESHGPLSPLVRGIAAFVPAIDELAAASPMPGLIRTFMSIVWLLVFLTTVAVVAHGKLPLDQLATLPWKRKWLMLSVLILAVIATPIWLLFFGGSDIEKPTKLAYSWLSRMRWNALTSRHWLAAWGFITYGTCSVVFAIALGLLRNFRRLWLPPRPRRRRL